MRVRLGHYLIFHDAPRSRIFIESIFEAYYPPSLQGDFGAVYYALPGAARVLVKAGAPIDAFGVGTAMVVSADAPRSTWPTSWSSIAASHG